MKVCRWGRGHLQWYEGVARAEMGSQWTSEHGWSYSDTTIVRLFGGVTTIKPQMSGPKFSGWERLGVGSFYIPYSGNV